MPVILVSNDDGVHAEGILALSAAMEALGNTYTIAPDRERSAAGHSLTIHRPLKLTELSKNRWSINGTPTDSVAVGIDRVLPERPALVVSGINRGPNLGDDITYSGTVAAAIEGTIYNIPSAAFSLAIGWGDTSSTAYYDTAAHYAARIASYVLQSSLPFDTLLNVNVPNLPKEKIRGVLFTRQGKRVYSGAVRETMSPWNEKFYWIGGGEPFWEHGPDTDMHALSEGFVSITPVHLDMTNYEALKFIKQDWPEKGA